MILYPRPVEIISNRPIIYWKKEYADGASAPIGYSAKYSEQPVYKVQQTRSHMGGKGQTAHFQA